MTDGPTRSKQAGDEYVTIVPNNLQDFSIEKELQGKSLQPHEIPMYTPIA